MYSRFASQRFRSSVVSTTLMLCCATTTRAACPAIGAAQLTYKDVAVELPAAPAEYLTLLADDCTDADPPATVVTGKVQLENRADTPQIVECRMGTDKAWDYSRVTVPASGSAVLMLVATNRSGSLAGLNLTKLNCRNATAGGEGKVSVSWMKVLTESVVDANVPLTQAP